VDRKYSHRGYRDAEKQDKKEHRHDKKPPQGGPRGQNDHLGPRTPRMVGTVTRARCSNCGAVLTPGFDPNGNDISVANGSHSITAPVVIAATTNAILFVIILGAAPSIANGLIAGVDYTPPLLLRAGRTMGLGRIAMYRHLILPASLPSFVAGLKQGWAFAWRSLMAGEIIGIVSHQPSLGQQLQFARDFADAQQLLALMIVIFLIGITIDSLFGALDRSIRR